MIDINIPLTGEKGYFTASTPFNNLVIPEVIHTVVSVRALREIAIDRSPLEDIYLNNSLTEDNYYDALSDNVHVIGLESDQGIVYIPSTHLVRKVNDGGVLYQDLAIVVPLGPVTTTFPTNILISEITDVVTKLSGIPTIPEVLGVSATVLMPETKHTQYQAVLASNKTRSKTFQTLYQETQYKYDKTLRVIDNLMCFIKENCCANGLPIGSTSISHVQNTIEGGVGYECDPMNQMFAGGTYWFFRYGVSPDKCGLACYIDTIDSQYVADVLGVNTGGLITLDMAGHCSMGGLFSDGVREYITDHGMLSS